MLTKHHFHRLAGLWEEELRSRGDGASLRRVVWHFCRTRLLLSILCLMVTQLAGFSGPVSNTISALCVFSLNLSLSLLLSLCIISFIDPPIKSCPPSNAQVSVQMGNERCVTLSLGLRRDLHYLCGVSSVAPKTILSIHLTISAIFKVP